MEQTISKSQYILWIVAVLLVFAVVTMLGSKVFYGLVVPQVQTINQLGVFLGSIAILAESSYNV